MMNSSVVAQPAGVAWTPLKLEDLVLDIDYSKLFEEDELYQQQQQQQHLYAMQYMQRQHQQVVTQQQRQNMSVCPSYNATSAPTEVKVEPEAPASTYEEIDCEDIQVHGSPQPEQALATSVPNSPRDVCMQPSSFHIAPEMHARPTATASNSKEPVRKDCLQSRIPRPKGTKGKLLVIASNGCELSTRNQKLTSQFKGVCWYKRTKKWVVQVKIRGIRQHVGYFDDEEEAAKAYKLALDDIKQKHF